MKVTLTKAELADMLFEQVGLNKREAKDMVEGFFEEISQSGLDPATQLPDINRIAAKYQLEIVGPPLE